MISTEKRISYVIRLFVLGIITLLGVVSAAMPQAAAAHETRTVTDMEFVVGFTEEPAIADEINGVLLEATRGGEPVEGLGDSLSAQILFGDQTKDVTLIPSFNEPGTYTATFIPTVEGDYTFRFYGEINGAEIDEYFTSSPEGFESVAPRSDYAFPLEEESAARLVSLPVLAGGVIAAIGALGLITRRHAHRP